MKIWIVFALATSIHANAVRREVDPKLRNSTVSPKSTSSGHTGESTLPKSDEPSNAENVADTPQVNANSDGKETELIDADDVKSNATSVDEAHPEAKTDGAPKEVVADDNQNSPVPDEDSDSGIVGTVGEVDQATPIDQTVVGNVTEGAIGEEPSGVDKDSSNDNTGGDTSLETGKDNSPEAESVTEISNVDGSEDADPEDEESEGTDQMNPGQADEPEDNDETGDDFMGEPELNTEPVPESDDIETDDSDSKDDISVREPVVESDHVNPTVNNDLQKPLAVFFLLSLIVTFVLYKIKKKTTPTGPASRGRYVALSDDDDEPLATTSFSSSSKDLTREEHKLLTNSDSEEERDVWRWS